MFVQATVCKIIQKQQRHRPSAQLSSVCISHFSPLLVKKGHVFVKPAHLTVTQHHFRRINPDMASACTVMIIDILGLAYFTFMCIVWKHTQVFSMSFLLKYGRAVCEQGPQWIDHCSLLTLIIQAWLPQSAAVKWIGRGHMLLSSGGEASWGWLIHICLIDTCPI